jgi:tetratricopeptide (TPR) repeat protein
MTFARNVKISRNIISVCMANRSLKILPERIDEANQALVGKFESQQQLANALYITRQPVNKFFNGKPIDRNLFLKICEKLDLDWKRLSGNLNSEDKQSPDNGSTITSTLKNIVSRFDTNLSPYQLPHDIADFTGRQQEQQKIIALLNSHCLAQVNRTAILILTISGMAGVGKSTLAVHIAHQQQEQFPDAQLYADLRGMEDQPLDASDVLYSWLRELGVNGSIPSSIAERASLYRSILAGKKALILLDNAKDAAQVRPLLPGSSSCPVIITSRRQLASLEGTIAVELGVMSDIEALELLEKLIGTARISSELEDARQIIQLCGFLPLAIRIAGGTLTQPFWKGKPLKDYVSRLADERNRLARLKLDDLDVRASINLSYYTLAVNDAFLFRYLGLLPGEFMALTAVTLIDWNREKIEESIERLINAQLLEVPVTGRYKFHDLVRLFAREKLEQEETDQSQKSAQLRLIRQYLEITQVMSSAIDPRTRPRLVQEFINIENTSPASDEVINSEAGLLAFAIDFFDVERFNIMTVVDWAYQTESWDSAIALGHSLFNIFDISGYWSDWERTCQLALEASRHAEDSYSEAQALSNLGVVHRRQGRWKESIVCYERSLELFRTLKSETEEAGTLSNLGIVYQRLGRWEAAIDCFEPALAVFRKIEDKPGEVLVLINLGVIHRLQCCWEQAIAYFKQALDLACEMKDIFYQVLAGVNVGNVYLQKELLEQAIYYYERALEGAKLLKSSYGESQVLSNLVIVYYKQGRLQECLDGCKKCLKLFQSLGDPQGKANILLLLSSVYNDQGQLEKGAELSQQSLQIYHELGDKHGEATALMNLGNDAQKKGKWEESSYFYSRSLEVFRNLGDQQGVAQVLRNMGTIAYKQNHWDDAVAYCVKSIEILQGLQDTYGVGLTLKNLGTMYSQKHQRNLLLKSVYCFQKSIEVFHNRDAKNEAETLVKLGSVFVQLDQEEQAMELFQKSKELFHDLEDIDWEAQVLLSIGIIYRRREKWEDALNCFQHALRMYRETGNKKGEANILANLGNLYRQKSQTSLAINYLQQSLMAFRDIGSTSNEAKVLVSLGLLYVENHQVNEGMIYLEEATAKLQPDSPEYSQIASVLQSIIQ